MVVLLTLRADCSLVTSKPAHLSPYLPTTTARRQVSPVRFTSFGIRTRLSSSTAGSVCQPFAKGWGIKTCKQPYAMQNKVIRQPMPKFEHGVANVQPLKSNYPQSGKTLALFFGF